MTLDSIEPNEPVVLTDELRRLFLAAGCDPACHACAEKIKVGSTLRLIPHTKPGGELRDEMVCDKCDASSLDKRDQHQLDAQKATQDMRRHLQSRTRGVLAGYSRPSRAKPAGSGG